MTKISVIVPVYNVEKYLRQCLESILAQSLKEIELICIDDGSTDKSADILDEYAALDGRIYVIHKKNTGYGNTMNIGIKNARGKYLAIVESDDWVQPLMFETLFLLAEQYHLDFIKSDYCKFRERTDGEIQVEPVHLCNNPKDYGQVFCPADKHEVFFAPINTWSGIYRANFINKYHIRHNESSGASYQDNGFWFQTFAYAKRAMFHYQIFYMNRRDNLESSIYCKDKVYAVCDEFDYIRSIMYQMEGQGKCFWPIYAYYRYINYLFTFNRIADQYKAEFLKRFQKDYQTTVKNGELLEHFFPTVVLEVLHRISDDPESYYSEYMSIKDKIQNILSGVEAVIIYGAGCIGQKLYHAMCDLQYREKIICFAVSEVCQPNLYMGVPVKCIDEVDYDEKKTRIVIAVKEGSVFSSQMKNKLESLGYKNYIEW